MTDAAAINILFLSAGAQDQLLRQYFSSEGTLPQYRGDSKRILIGIRRVTEMRRCQTVWGIKRHPFNLHQQHDDH